jgi:PAS domain S-box-containing protein
VTEESTTRAGEAPDLLGLFDALFTSASDCVLLSRTDGPILRANPAACAALGRTEAEIRRDGRAGIAIPSPGLTRGLAERDRTGVASGEMTFRRADGSTFLAEVTSTVIHQVGAVLYAYVLFRDVTERRTREESQREALATARARTAELQALLDAVPAAVFITRDRQVRSMETNHFGAVLMNPAPGAFKAMREGREIPPSELPVQLAAATGREVKNYEFDLVTADGVVKHLLGNATPLRGESGEPAGAVGAFTDITDRKAAELALRERETQLRAYFDCPAVGIVVTSPEKGWVEINDQACTMLGYSREELHRCTWADLTHPADIAADVLQFERALAGEIDGYSMDKRYVRKDGSILWALLSVSCVRANGGAIEYFVGVLTDIGQRKTAEEGLRRSESRFRTLAEAAPVGIFETDAEGRNVYLNPAAAEIMGQSPVDAQGAGWSRAVHPDDRERVLREWTEAVGAARVFSSEYRFARTDGTVVLVRGYASGVRDARGQVTGYIGVVIDISERRAMRQQLALASRMAAMGTLVAGIAHEINNPLVAALSGQGLALGVARETRVRLQEGAPADPKAEILELDDVIEGLEDAQEGASRIARIVKELAAFAQPDPRRSPASIQEVVDSAMRWLPASIEGAAAISVEHQRAPEILASVGELEQVVVHLVTNAAKATPPGRKGTITLRTGTADSGGAFLEVVDRGVGIAPAILQRIFEPFFTTRPVGEGRGPGLGLAVSHAIVASHAGALTVKSTPGEGTTFRLELPAASSPT